MAFTRACYPFCAVLGALMAAACGPLSESHNPQLATVDYWPDEQLLFVATPNSGIVDVMRVPPSPRQGLDFVERLSEPARKTVVRLSVDRARGRLWVLDSQAVYIYSLKQSARATVIPIRAESNPAHTSTGIDPWITDLVLDNKGNGYVLVYGGTLIYRVDATSLNLERWVQTTAGLNQPPRISPSRALLTQDSRYLFFQAPNHGRLRRVDVVSKGVEAIPYPAPIDLSCGYLFWIDHRHGRTLDSAPVDPSKPSLTVFDCHNRRTIDITLDTELRRIARPEIYQSR